MSGAGSTAGHWPIQAARHDALFTDGCAVLMAMIEEGLVFLEHAARGISLFAVLVIVVGFVLATSRYAGRFSESTHEENFRLFKIDLGTKLLLGLEILVLADVIETITIEQTFTSMAFLAAIVIIRTLVSWTLTLEIEGHWPWQKPLEESGDD